VIPEAAADEVADLQRRGARVSTFVHASQCYVQITGVEVPSPPWERSATDILVPIPATYDNAALDGFYVLLPLGWNKTNHRRINGSEIEINGRRWRAVSWHYPDGRAWERGKDTIESHIEHCRGFFLHRGATNGY
jgi:hypothetical protein